MDSTNVLMSMETSNVSTLNEVELSVPIVGTNINDILWRKISNFHDISWLFNNTCVLEEIWPSGGPFREGATRTYRKVESISPGGKETVLKLDEERKFLQWDLDSYDGYKASLEVNNEVISYKVQAKVPEEQLLKTKDWMESRLLKLVADSNITEDDKLIMDESVACLDAWTRLLLRVIPKDVLTASEKLTTDAAVKPPTLEKQLDSRITILPIGKYKIKVLKEDDYYGDLSFIQKAKLWFLSRLSFFPVNDKYIDFPDHLVEKFREHYLFNKCWPPQNQHITELESDDSISRMAFYGVMSMWMKDDQESEDNKDGFMCDYSQMVDLTPRKGFRKLGAKGYFDSTFKLIRIHDCAENRNYDPNSPGWSQAKTLLKISCAHWNTACDHLVGVHMMATNSVVNAAVQNLPITHHVRRLIQPFSFRSVFVNNRALTSLLCPGSVVVHASCYNSDELTRLLEIGIESCQLWGTPEERIELAGPNIQKLSNEGKFPYGNHSSRLYKCFEQFVANFIDHTYKSDQDVQDDLELQGFASDLYSQVKGSKLDPPETYTTKKDVVKVISTFIFNATGMHEYVGTVSEYIDHPRKMGFRLRKGYTSVDFQGWLVGMLLFTVTTVPMPKLLDKFDNCYGQGLDDKEYEINEWDKCLESLKNLSKKLQEETGTLKYSFKSFDPEYLECSVNV
jgi:hypothetical protein